MIYDNSLLLSDAQAITADAASTNVIDLGATGTPYGGSALTRDIGIGEECVYLSVRVTETFNNLTSLVVQVQTSPDNSSWTTIQSGQTVLLAALVAGYQFETPYEFPEGTKARYVRLFYDITGTAPTTGKITAGVVMARQTNKTIGGA
jgi:hypothetical protein